MSYAKNILFRTTPQVNQTDDLAKVLGVTPQQGTAPIALPEARQLEVKENGDPLEPYFNGFDEGRTGESVAEAARQSGAQGAALDAAGLRQDADMNAALSGQRTGELAEGAGDVGKIPWDSWQNYEKVTENGQEYAKVGDRLYSKHAVSRMQPSGNRFGIYIYEGLNGKDYGRSIAPQYVEDVINSTKPVYQPRTGNYSHALGNIEVIVNPQGAVVTILTYK